MHPHTRFRRPSLQRQDAFRVEGNADCRSPQRAHSPTAPTRRAARLIAGFDAPILRVAANESEFPSRKLAQGLQAPKQGLQAPIKGLKAPIPRESEFPARFRDAPTHGSVRSTPRTLNPEP